MAEKSILEQALLQVQTLEEAVKQNAKGILASTMKQELNDLLKESEEEEDELPEEEANDMSEQPELDSEDEDEEGDEENMDDLDNEDEDMDDMDDTEDMDDEDMDDMDDEGMGGMDDEFGSEDSMDDEFSDEDSMDDELPSFDDEDSMDDDVVDMTNASHDEVLRVFKAMKPEDGIVVKKDGDDVELDVDGDEYIIKLDDEGDDMSDDFDMSEMDDMSDDDEAIFEIELDEEDETDIIPSNSYTGRQKKIDAMEAARTKSNPHGDKGPGQGRTGLKSKKVFKAGSGALNEEVKALKKQNSEYKKALVLFKEKLNEVAVFNANLAYATRLFTEHSTTKQEKLNILKRFDSVSTMNESKNLFSTIKGELENKKPITESVVNKIANTPKSSSSQEILSEAKAYENPQFKRMRDLMSKLK